MQRRRHKKSRAGCAECKRRHIRCDQTKPTCLNCTLASRGCVYAHADRISTSASTSKDDRDGSSLGSASSQGASASPAAPLLPCRLATFSLPATPGTGLFNLNHMRLLDHFLADGGIFSNSLYPELATPVASPPTEKRLLQGRRYVAAVAFEAPYLMLAILAYSAHQISIEKAQTLPAEQLREAREQASELQMAALTDFNAAPRAPSAETAEAIFLFSSFLGTKLLSEALANRHGGLDGFIEVFLANLEIHRGIKNLSTDLFHFLATMNSPLWKMLEPRTGLFKQQGHGNECRPLRQLILENAALPYGAANACYKAVNMLQVAFDNPRDLGKKPELMPMAWPIVVEQEYLELLRDGLELALAILAYYGAMLHMYRHTWLVGDAGRYLVGLVREKLGDSANKAIAWAIDFVASDADRP